MKQITGAFLFIFLLFFSSCSVVPVVVSYDPKVEKLREGEQQYKLGHYQAADTMFTEVFFSNPKMQTANTALYNMICSRIMKATTPEEVRQAVKLATAWKNLDSKAIYVENPNLALHAFKQIGELLAVEQQRAEARHLQVQKTLFAQKKRIATLQKQIAELEAIDQELQEKKKPL